MATSVATETLIARLLEQDLQTLGGTRMAEKLQLDEIIKGSGIFRAAPSKTPPPTDTDIAEELQVRNMKVEADAALAEALQAQDAAIIANHQAAQRVAAGEKKIMIDAEYAKKVQALYDNGETGAIGDADSLLDKKMVDDILASDPNDKGKGKTVIRPTVTPGFGAILSPFQSTVSPYQHLLDKAKRVDVICGICGDAFQETHSPILASLTANVSSRLPFGLRLPCPDRHPYCISCLSQYILSKLDPENLGQPRMEHVVFPIRCPECPVDKWADGIPDEVGVKVLGEKNMVLWHSQKLVDSLPKHYCPNPRCSALVQVPDDDTFSQAICPACQTMMCVPCKTVWHPNYTCAQYQRLPIDERSPEDQKLFQLVKEQGWRRCPKCKRVIELTHGCNHLTCVCKAHFCFKCGAPWDMIGYKCTRGAGCALWDDPDMLLDEDERQRVRGAAPVGLGLGGPRLGGAAFGGIPNVFNAGPPPPPYRPAPPPPPPAAPVQPARRQQGREDFGWLTDGRPAKHPWTKEMVQSSQCGYCNRGCGSLNNLRNHLETVRHHPVYSCCHKFFRTRQHLDQHESTMSCDGIDTVIREFD